TQAVVIGVTRRDPDRPCVHDLDLVLLQHHLDAVACLEALFPGRDGHGSGKPAIDVDLHPERLRVDNAAYRLADGEGNVPFFVAIDTVARIDALQSHIKSDLPVGGPVFLGPIAHCFVVDPVPCTDNRRVGVHNEVALDRGAILYRGTEVHLDREADADRLAAERHDRRVQLALGLYCPESRPAGGRSAVGVTCGGRHGVVRVEVEYAA